MNASGMARALLLAIAPETALDLPRPHTGQQTVIADAQRFNVLAAGRRWGKNTLAEGRIVLPALQGRPVAWFSPSYKTLADDWRRLLEILRPVVRDKKRAGAPNHADYGWARGYVELGESGHCPGARLRSSGGR